MNLTYVKTELMQRNNFNSKDPFTQRGCVCVCVKLQHCVYGMLRQMQRMGIEPIFLRLTQIRNKNVIKRIV